MDSQRNIIIVGLLFVSFMIFDRWNHKDDIQPVAETTIATQNISDTKETTTVKNTITINSDVLSLTIDTHGGDVIESRLLKYDETLKSKAPFKLLQDDSEKLYVARSGLIGKNGIDTNNNRPDYTVSAKNFTMAKDKNELIVPLSYTKDGISYTKNIILKRGSYAVKVQYKIENNTATPAQMTMYTLLKQSLPEEGKSMLGMKAYNGAVYSENDTHYQKYTFDEIADDDALNIKFNRGWVAMIQHYFANAWIPNKTENHTLFTRTSDKFREIGTTTEYQIPANSSKAFAATLWTGPKLAKQMESTAEYLDLTIDYSWLWFIAKPLHSLLTFIQNFVGNWGVAIIILTFIVRGAMYPLTKVQYTSMAKMRMLQPKIQAMREKFGEDKQRMSQEMMALYKTEKVNPLGGCFPIFLQMPIFLALYWSLMESVGLRHAPFFGWIHDLSAQDPYFILPILMGCSMMLIQKMNPPAVTDPIQKKVMTFMPVIFTVFFLFFPAGLVLYWLMSNIVTLIHQTIIYRALEKKGLHSRK